MLLFSWKPFLFTNFMYSQIDTLFYDQIIKKQIYNTSKILQSHNLIYYSYFIIIFKINIYIYWIKTSC